MKNEIALLKKSAKLMLEDYCVVLYQDVIYTPLDQRGRGFNNLERYCVIVESI